MIPAFALTRRGRGFVIAALGVLAAWYVIGLRDMCYLAALLLATVALSAAAASLVAWRAAPRVRLSVTDSTPTVGKRTVLTAVLEHGLRSRLRAQAVWEVAGSRLEVPVTIDPAQTALVSVEWRPLARGRAEARVAALLVEDPLGLVRRRARCGDAVELLALPRPLDALPAPGHAAAFESSDGSEAQLQHALSAGTPGGAVREYRSGDAPRQIHWKQSARQGELLVNLQEHNTHTERALWLDLDPEAYESEARFSLAISAAATLALHWIGEGHVVRLRLGADAPVLCTTVDQALRELASVPLRAETPESVRESAGLPAVVVTGEVSQRLGARLSLEHGGGDVYALRGSNPRWIPEQWRYLVITGRRPGGSDAPSISPDGDRR